MSLNEFGWKNEGEGMEKLPFIKSCSNINVIYPFIKYNDLSLLQLLCGSHFFFAGLS